MKDLHKKILVTLFAVIFLALPTATFIFMPQEISGKPVFSENENRYLSSFVKPNFTGYIGNFFNGTPNNIKNKQFMNGFDSWFADRFILREDWIILQNELETLSGKFEINGVYVVDDRMIQSWREDAKQTKQAELTTDAIDKFAGELQELHGTKSYLMLIPTAQEIYKDLLPANSQPGNQAALIKYCYDRTQNLVGIDAMTYLVQQESDSYLYYRTDHHWTAYGSYWGYYAAAKSMGITPYELGRFNVEHASSDFRGTLFSKTLNFRVTPDSILFYTHAQNPPKVKLTINNGGEITEHDSLYLREFLSKKDKYAAYMGLNSPIMEITTDIGGNNDDNSKSLLVFKDSFAHCMLPFVANHYSRITVLDMRYINTDIREIVDLEDYSEVLFIYSATNFAEDTDLRKISPP